jgi:trk system potassium uptake protein TrkH
MFYVLGVIFLALATAMVIPAILDFTQNRGVCFLVAGTFCCFIGGLLFFSYRTHETLNLKERILVMLFAWSSVPILSSIPLLTSGPDMAPLDCIFEMASALTTTGASVISDSLSEGLLLWRSLLQLFGCAGVAVSWLYVFPYFLSTTDVCGYGRASSWPLQTVMFVYLSIMLVGSFLLMESGMSAVDALCCVLDSISSGGISGIHPSTGFWLLVPAIMMFISGLPITLLRNLSVNGITALRDPQFICYVLIISIVTVFFTIYQILFSDGSVVACLQRALLTTVSSMTTTDIRLDESAPLVASCFQLLGFCGGGLGSCGGGVKIFRLIMTYMILKGYFIRLVKNNAVYVPTYAGKKLEESDITGLFSYFLSYLFFALLASLVLVYLDVDFGKALSVVLTSCNNDGPFWGLHRMTASEIAVLAPSVKIILIISMIVGRVEFISFFVIFTKIFWKK